MNVILLGPPGSGKGTQSDMLRQRLGIPQISTGEMLRAARQANTSLGRQVASYIESGRLVPDDIVVQLIQERLQANDVQHGFVLDGFPRTIAQAESLERMLQQIRMTLDVVINLEVPTQILVSRLQGRRTCEACGSGYHVEFSPSSRGDHCERCGGRLIQRDDDQEATIQSRLQVYHDQTACLVDYYRQRSLLKIVLGQGSIDEIFNAMMSAIQSAKRIDKS